MYAYHNGHYYTNSSNVFASSNRSFRYGDGLFETIVVFKRHAPFLSDHIARLLKGMRVLKMTIPAHFKQAFFEDIIQQLLNNNHIENACIRLMVYRTGIGKYEPTQSNIGILVECFTLQNKEFKLNEQGLTIGLFKDIPKPINILSNLKTNNALIYILAAIYKQEQAWHDCLLINTKANVIEATSANIFTVKNSIVYTPPLSEGSVAGIMRMAILSLIKTLNMPIYEIIHSEQTLLQADEIWLTNAVRGIRWVKQYTTKRYNCTMASQIVKKLNDNVF